MLETNTNPPANFTRIQNSQSMVKCSIKHYTKWLFVWWATRYE